MNIYYCKCGRVVKKSTQAATTGNRDTVGCKGCPYLLPYGPYKHVDGQGFVMDVQGYECRMTEHPVDYCTHIGSPGGPNDKTSIRLESLDFDFLEDVTDWVKETYPGGELTGGFDRREIRGTDYFDGVRVSFYPAQNKKGIAAKQALFRRFFHPDGTRLDMTPEEEKAKVLADIETGKAAANRKAETMENVYKCVKGNLYGVLYKVGEIGELGNADRTKLTIKQLGTKPGSVWRKKSNAPEWSITNRKDAEKGLTAMAEQNGWQLASEAEIQYNPTERAALLDDDPDGTCLKPTTFADLGLSDSCIKLLTKDYAFDDDDLQSLHGLLPEERGHLQTAYSEDWKKIYAYLWPDCTDTNDSTAEESSEVENPTSSAVATAAAGQIAESPEPAALHFTTETAASTNEKTDDAATLAPASEGMPTAFDYGEDAATNAQLVQCAQAYVMGKVAMVMAVKRAHTLTANHKNGTFGKWCASVGISRDKGNQLVNIADNFGNIEIDGKPLIELAPLSLLAEAAKPSTPKQIQTQVAAGDITSRKEYKEAMARIKTLEDQNKQLKHENEMERKEQEDANASAMHYKAEADRRAEDQQRLEGLVETANQKADLAARKSAEAWEQVTAEKAARKEAEAKAAEIQQMYDTDMPEMQRFIDKAQAERDEYKSLAEAGQPSQLIATVSEVDQEEIERRAQELAGQQMAVWEDRLRHAEKAAGPRAKSVRNSFIAIWASAGLTGLEITDADDLAMVKDLRAFLMDAVKVTGEMLAKYEEV